MVYSPKGFEGKSQGYVFSDAVRRSWKREVSPFKSFKKIFMKEKVFRIHLTHGTGGDNATGSPIRLKKTSWEVQPHNLPLNRHQIAIFSSQAPDTEEITLNSHGMI